VSLNWKRQGRRAGAGSAAGKVTKILVSVGDKISVGAALMSIGDGGGAPAAAAPKAAPAALPRQRLRARLRLRRWRKIWLKWWKNRRKTGRNRSFAEHSPNARDWGLIYARLRSEMADGL